MGVVEDLTNGTRKSTEKHQGCRACGAPAVAWAQIRLRLKDESGRQQYGKSLGRSISLCASHANEVWQELEESLARRES